MTNDEIMALAALHIPNVRKLTPELLGFARALLAAAAPTPSEPVEYQHRMRPTWRDEGEGWTEWTKCSAGSYQDYLKTPLLHDWQHEVRKLYAAPAPSARHPSEVEAGQRGLDAMNAHFAAPSAPSDFEKGRLAGLREAADLARLYELGTPEGHAIADAIERRAATPAPTAPNFCLLIDELLAAWRVQGNDVPVKDRRIAARAALEQAIAQRAAPAPSDAGMHDAIHGQELLRWNRAQGDDAPIKIGKELGVARKARELMTAAPAPSAPPFPVLGTITTGCEVTLLFESAELARDYSDAVSECVPMNATAIPIRPLLR